MKKKKDDLIKDIFIILILASFTGLVCNFINPSGFDFSKKTIKKYNKIIYISTEEAGIKYDSNITFFVDSRDSSEYNYAHIKKAINIPVSDDDGSSEKTDEKIAKLNVNRELVIYCNGESCSSSTILAKKIIDRGYPRHIYIIKKGFPHWEIKGFPVKKYKK